MRGIITREILEKEADKKFQADKKRIQKSLENSPDPNKYLEIEKRILFNILHKEIDILNDCEDVIIKGLTKTIYDRTSGLKYETHCIDRYYRTGHFDYDINYIRSIRNLYRLYLSGMTAVRAIDKEIAIDAIRFFLLEKWLNEAEQGYPTNLISDQFRELNGKYIQTNIDVFTSVMINKQLPKDANKIIWLTTKTEAVYFQIETGFTMKQFNACFIHQTGTGFNAHNRSPSSPIPKDPLPQITTKLIDTLKA
ncbi:MAG: hypothetical protein GX126_17580 [Bacteroidales bacterium]|jgi:frataxin-like iron-binding protein CyaY|nr:hypothetical protein [Bacteroidales bacterium]